MSLRRGGLDEIPGLGGNSSVLTDAKVKSLKSLPGHPFNPSKAESDRAKEFVSRYNGRALPVIIDQDNHVLVGLIFVEAAKTLGLGTIRVIQQSGLSSTEALLAATAISKFQTLGNWDGEALDQAVRQFEAAIEDFSSTLIGLAPGELDRLIGASSASAGADKIPMLQNRPVTAAGWIWQCGPHQVLCGDATSQEAVEAFLGGQKVAVALTDPPFGCKVDGFVAKKGLHRDFVQGAGELDENGLFDFFLRFCRAIGAVLAPGALVYLFIDWRSLSLLQRAAETVFGKLVNLCIWAKDRAGMGSFYRSQHEMVLVFAMPGQRHRNNIELGRHGRDRSNVWSYPAAASSRKGREGDILRHHPTPKPVEMIAEALIDSSVRGEIVLDCFLGSGTMLIAAERTGRVLRGVELDPLYVDLAVRRWQSWTGQDAIEIGSGRTFNDIAKEADRG